ncbi:MAG: bifunctional UDP-sugar hydrolase/5'-nucleotidase [Eubacteriales bacterium]|nr:bifunctional UDP-sugar hydrolase/5'-nucleotidase [Eubacteriales bacterium]
MGEKTVKLYFTSDVHGCFSPMSWAGRNQENMGLLHCAGQFHKDENTLILDGGDALQGSPFTAYCHDCEKSPLPVAHLMNLCGYDYVTLGNHDFNFGVSYLTRYIDGLQADCLCENLVRQDGTAAYPGKIRVMGNGIRIGIVGIVTDYINIWEKPEHLEGYQVTDPFTAARRALEALKGRVDLTVCIYHGGFERDLDTGRRLSSTTEDIGYRICQELDFDILLTGHQHMSVSGREVWGTFTVQPSENAREFHEITVSFGEKVKITSEKRMAAGAAPAELARAIESWNAPLQKWLDTPVGSLERPLLPDTRLNMASRGSEIAAFFNQVQLDFSGAQLSATSLANEISGIPQSVRRRDVLTTYPYQNTLKVLEITGAVLREALEHSAAYFALDRDGTLRISEAFLKPKVEHYNYDYFAGVTYTVDPARPVGSRVVTLMREGQPVRPDQVLTICVSDYRASGAGGYEMYAQCRVLREYDREMSDIIMEYFEAHKTIPPLGPPNYSVITGNLEAHSAD